jgi:hypothetical protein
MPNSPQPLTEQINDIIDTIVKLTRHKNQTDPSQIITPEERDKIMIKALGTYQLLSERSINNNGRVLIEYQQNFHEITEEIFL